MSRRAPLEAGAIFGRLTYIEDLAPGHGGDHFYCARFRCDCGAGLITAVSRVRRGAVRSCGCLKADLRPRGSAARGIA